MKLEGKKSKVLYITHQIGPPNPSGIVHVVCTTHLFFLFIHEEITPAVVTLGLVVFC